MALDRSRLGSGGRGRGRKWQTVVRGGPWKIRTAVVDGQSRSRRRHSSYVLAHTAAESNKNHCPTVVVAVVPPQSSTGQSSHAAAAVVVFPTAVNDRRRFPLPEEPVIPYCLHVLITRILYIIIYTCV